jgi:predicted nucleic acid-binding protein
MGNIAGNVVDAFVGIAEPVEVHYQWRPQLNDAGDEMVLEAAVNGRADAIVTFNRRDYGASPARFGIRLLSPIDTLRSIRR